MPTSTDRGADARLRWRAATTLLLSALLLGQQAGTVLAAALWIGTADVARPVWVDHGYVGLAPVWVDDLGEGVHTIEVGARPGSTEWSRPWSRRVTLSVDETARVEVPRLQVLRILSTGRSLEVAIDEEPIGWTPLHLLIPSDRSLEVRSGGQAPVLYRAAGAADSTLLLSGPAEPRRDPARVEFARRGLLRPLGAVAFGVLGAWARQEGDRAYEDYLTTVERDRMRSRYDRAERYDDLAVGCWVAAEVLLVASVWKWLRGSGTESPNPSGAPLSLEIADPGELRLAVTLPLGGSR